MANMPSTKRMMGDEPARGRNSPVIQGRDQRAEHETDDLGPQVLDHLGPVQAERSGSVALETGHADAHVGRVAEFLQQRGEHADDRAHRDDAPPGGKDVFSLHDR